MGAFKPRDVRWQGPQQHYFTVFTLKNLFILFFAILIIVEGVLYRKWRTRESSVEPKYGPHYFWYRIGYYLIIDSVLTLAMAYFIHVQRWHPIAALVTSICWFGNWLAGLLLNLFTVMSNEISFYNDDKWYNICYAEVGFQTIFALLYVAMMVYAAIAVHRWRMEKLADERLLELTKSAPAIA